jgi:hypothetical protein
VGSTWTAQGEAAARLVVPEKIREDRLRGTGLEMVRWDFRDVRRTAPAVVDRIRGAWERGDLGRFRGRLVTSPAPPLRAATSAFSAPRAGRNADS